MTSSTQRNTCVASNPGALNTRIYGQGPIISSVAIVEEGRIRDQHDELAGQRKLLSVLIQHAYCTY